jgi:lauroyl/myristoyl acyltransferase
VTTFAADGRARRRPSLRDRVLAFALRVGSAVLCRIPEPPLNALADAAGALWYRMGSRRAAQGRLNLGRVCRWLTENGQANDRIRAAAVDPDALEGLLRATFRHTARYYLEVARAGAVTRRMIEERLVVETPAAVDEAMSGGAAIIVGLHFGAIEMPAMFFAMRTGFPVSIPMETIADEGLQAWFEASRGATGVRIVPLREARSELTAALRRGEPVGLVGDRDLTGGGIRVPLFGAEASLPAGPGLLALESGARVFVASVRRTPDRRYRGRVEEVVLPADGTRRERLTAFLVSEAQAFERAIALAPEQWWALFFPIWPDLVAADRPGRSPHGARP